MVLAVLIQSTLIKKQIQAGHLCLFNSVVLECVLVWAVLLVALLATGTNTADLDFDSVQRGNPEMERRAQEVINACRALG